MNDQTTDPKEVTPESPSDRRSASNNLLSGLLADFVSGTALRYRVDWSNCDRILSFENGAVRQYGFGSAIASRGSWLLDLFAEPEKWRRETQADRDRDLSR